jgi:hypothetical protein
VSNTLSDAPIVGSVAITTAGSSAPRSPIVIATVIRSKYGTGPFDENWLNVDCCGFFVRLLVVTNVLHLYGTCLIMWVISSVMCC